MSHLVDYSVGDLVVPVSWSRGMKTDVFMRRSLTHAYEYDSVWIAGDLALLIEAKGVHRRIMTSRGAIGWLLSIQIMKWRGA